jgi:hypothetical protein
LGRRPLHADLLRLEQPVQGGPRLGIQQQVVGALQGGELVGGARVVGILVGMLEQGQPAVGLRRGGGAIGA